MAEQTKRILALPPRSLSAAAPFGLTCAHMAYRPGAGGQLLRCSIPVNLRGGLMVLPGNGWDGRGGESLQRRVCAECARRSFEGVVLDFEGPPRPGTEDFAARLDRALAEGGRALYVHPEYARCTSRARVIFPSALSGGSLEGLLREGVERYGQARVALGIRRTAEDFTLPAPDGCGRPLDKAQLERLRRGRSVFFSRELCQHYFTYMDPERRAHFVLFDDAASIRRKLVLAGRLGLAAVLLAWPEVEDILPAVLEQPGLV